ncbi:MAG: hypothetical protein ACTS5G_04275 [Burkholderiales bacterium]
MTKSGAIKLPKRIAGVKIPKVIRKGPIGEFLQSSAGQLVIAETLLAAAAAFTAAKADTSVGDAVRHPVDKARRAGQAMADAGANETDRLAHAFREAGRAFREALHQNSFFAVLRDEDAGEDRTKAKKKSSGRPVSGLH